MAFSLLEEVARTASKGGMSMSQLVAELKRTYLRVVLTENRGNQCRASLAVGQHRNTTARQITELGIDLAATCPPRKRPAGVRSSWPKTKSATS